MADNDSNAIEDSEWIRLSSDGTFECIECENQGVVETSGEDGMEEADLSAIKSELFEHPKKVVYGACGVCGMEYQFKLTLPDEDAELVLLPSDEEK